jgi:hypothetical protein
MADKLERDAAERDCQENATGGEQKAEMQRKKSSAKAIEPPPRGGWRWILFNRHWAGPSGSTASALLLHYSRPARRCGSTSPIQWQLMPSKHFDRCCNAFVRFAKVSCQSRSPNTSKHLHIRTRQLKTKKPLTSPMIFGTRRAFYF